MEKSGEAFKVFRCKNCMERYGTRCAVSPQSHASGSQLGDVTDGTMHPSGCLRTRKVCGDLVLLLLTDVVIHNTTFAARRRRSYCSQQ